MIPRRTRRTNRKVCPQCRHAFQGKGWEGIDAHWKSKLEDIMPYEKVWPLIRDGRYKPHFVREEL